MTTVSHLRARVFALWLEGLDTYAMAKALQIAEATCERALHEAMELRRSIRTSLGSEA